MGCCSKVIDITISVFTDGSATPIFIPATDALPTRELVEARITLDFAMSSGAMSVERAVRGTDDHQTWSSANALGTDGAISSSGWDYSSGFTSVSQAKRFGQLGLLVANTSGQARHKGVVRLIIELRCS